MSFDFKEIDEEGLETLEAITEATAFNEWMYKTILPHCTGKILEIGSGIGNISAFFIEHGHDIVLSDIRDNYLDALKDRYPSTPRFNLDLVHKDFENMYASHVNKYDSVFALNVIEHIEDHALAMNNIAKLLKKNGQAVILVPAFQTLYNKIDKELYHYRRYTKRTLGNIFAKELYSITHTRFFNFMGIPAWFIGGKLMGDSTVKKGKMRLYNAMVPIFKLIDYPTKKIAGLSVITVAKKN